MIVYDLICDSAHRFEGWFGSSGDFASQKERGLLSCPVCGSEAIAKAPMAPAVPAKGNQGVTASLGQQADKTKSVSNTPMPPEVAKALTALAKAQSKALEKSEWVGDKFVENARSMHYGETDEKPIHGRATPDEARGLMEEGVAVSPLIVPVAPPDELN